MREVGRHTLGSREPSSVVLQVRLAVNLHLVDKTERIQAPLGAREFEQLGF